MTTKERLHLLIDALPEGEAGIVERMLRGLRTAAPADAAPPLYTLDNAPPDDEPYTDEERAAVAEAWEDVRTNPAIPHEEVKRRLGLS
ncbi:MAG: hypothetical protein ACREKN_06895 [Longimicrobiaceae bacterium]